MAKISQTEKELRQPDALQKAGAPLRDWMSTHQRAVMLGAGAVLVALLGVALASTFSRRGEAEASKALSRSLEVLGRPVGTEPGAPASPDKPPFQSEKERDEAVRKELTDFRSAYARTRAATTAALPLAQAEYRLGNFDAALALDDEFLKDAPQDDPLRASALEGRGYALEAKGQLDEALGAFDQMAAANRPEFLTGMGAYHRARILIEQGKQADAVQALQQLQVNHPNTAAARLASERLQILASQGVTIPPPPAAKSEADAG
ncbi:MAG: tetratricopeptide repeat protein [Myxococcaceae bacterium]|nr:tetratricopeptide repeat protein [Myxococcaceae bacterium]MCI0671776.1 tetratricopeptide repeat protein [Myxococcaceae bacterium]